MTHAIEARGLGRTFTGGIEAVKSIDLAVPTGSIFGFLGPNGAGKTTAVRMLTTLLGLTRGSATVAGYDVVRQPDLVRKSIGVALQEAGLDPLLTGKELLILHGRLQGLGRRSSGRADELLGTVGLTDAADRRVKTYSGGMQRRLDLAVALVHRPQVLFLDEPTTGLDPTSRVAVWDEVRELNAQGMTIFLTTQYLEEADQLAEQLAIIDEGEIIAEGTPAELKASIGADRVEVGLDESDIVTAKATLADIAGNRDMTVTRRGLVLYVDDGPAAVARVVTALDGAGVRLGTVSTASPSLDDVFITKTGRRLEGAPNDRSADAAGDPGDVAA